MSAVTLTKTKKPLSQVARGANEKRRGVRMNSRVPISVQWLDSQDRTLQSKAYTCVVSSYGCLVVLPESLELDQQVAVLNMATNQTIPGTVVWKGNLREGGWELGIELRQPPLDFWGLEL
jgi:hypothetical protein